MTVANASEHLMPAAVVCGEEDARLARLKQLVAGSLPNAANLGDTTLRRFLVAEKNDPSAAAKRLASFVSWRQKEGIDNILQTFKFPERDTFLQLYPQGFHQTDLQGRPVYAQQIGVVNHSALQRLLTDERMLRYHIHEMERFVQVLCPACSRAAGKPITQMLSIIDVKGLSFMDLGKVKRLLGLYMQVDAQFYPETLGRLLIINAPSWFASSFQLVKQFMDPNTQAKVEILGSSYQQELLSQVAPEQLLAEYGGRSRSKLADDVGPWNDPRYLCDTSSTTADTQATTDGSSTATSAATSTVQRRSTGSSSEPSSPSRSHRASLSISIPAGSDLGQVVPVAAVSKAGSLSSPFADLQQAGDTTSQLGPLGDSTKEQEQEQQQSSSALPPMPATSQPRRTNSGGWQHHSSGTLLRRQSSANAADNTITTHNNSCSNVPRASFHSCGSDSHSLDGTESNASGFQTPLAAFQSGTATPSGFSGYATPKAVFNSGLATPSSPSGFFTPRGSVDMFSTASTPRSGLHHVSSERAWQQAPLVQMMHSSLTLAATMHEQQQQNGTLSRNVSSAHRSGGSTPSRAGRGVRTQSFPVWHEEGEEDLHVGASEGSSDDAGSGCCMSLRGFKATFSNRRGKYVPLDTIDGSGEDDALALERRRDVSGRGGARGGWWRDLYEWCVGDAPKSPKVRLLQQQGAGGSWCVWVKTRVCCCDDDGW